MGATCTAKNCKNRSGSSKRKFFRFPSDSARARIWVINCNREDLMNKVGILNVSHRLCQDHFEERMFTNHQRTRLRVKAFPTLFPLTEVSSEEDTDSSNDLDHSYAAVIDSSTELFEENSENAPIPAQRNENDTYSEDEFCTISINKSEIFPLKEEDEIDTASQSQSNNLQVDSVDKFFSDPPCEPDAQTGDDFAPKCKRELPDVATENGFEADVKIETDHMRDELLEHNYCGVEYEMNSPVDQVENSLSPELRNFASVGTGFNLAVAPEENPPSPKVNNCTAIDHGVNFPANVGEQRTAPKKGNFHSIDHKKNSLKKAEKNTTFPESQNFASVGQGINKLILPEKKPTALTRIPLGHRIQTLIQPEEITPTVQKCIPVGQAINSVLTPITAPKGWKFVTVGNGHNFVMNQPVQNYVSVGNGINLLVVPEGNSPSPNLQKCIPVGYGIISPANVQGINAGLEVQSCMPDGHSINSIVNADMKSSARHFILGVHGNSSVVMQQNTQLVPNFDSGSKLVVNIDQQTTPPAAKHTGSVGQEINLLAVSEKKNTPSKVLDSMANPVGRKKNSPMNQECESTAPKVRKCNPEAVALGGIPPPLKIRSCNPVDVETYRPKKQEQKTTALKVRNCLSDTQVEKEKVSSSKPRVPISISSTQTSCSLSANSPRKNKLREVIRELNREKEFLKRRIVQLEKQLSER